jgi:hypothetical protein
MKKLIFPFTALVAILFATSCSEKFKVAAPYKDITVIYGFLQQSDTAHYIRVQKAFLDQEKSAVSMAKVADSSFYKQINVRIERFTAFGSTNTYKDSIHLERVDLNTEGYPKQPGQFFDAPNYAYKFKGTLDPQYFYRIIVTNLVTGKRDSANAPIINESPATFGVPILDDPYLNIQKGLNFFSALPKRTVTIDGHYYNPANYNFYGQTSPAGIAQLTIRFHWVDTVAGTGARTARYCDYTTDYVPMTSAFEYKIENINLYNTLKLAMADAPPTVTRLMEPAEIFAYISTPDYATYHQVVSTQGTGLTGSEIQPNYTNVKGDDALGMFTARGLRRGTIKIAKQTMDSLVISPIMSGTNLRGTNY